MNWNNTTYTDIVTKHPILDGKPESVAIAVWALSQNAGMTPQEWQTLSAKTGVRVAGRAVGSARQILGLQAGRTPAAKKTPKRGRGRPKGSKNKNKVRATSARSATTTTSNSGNSVDALVATLKQLQRERDEAVRALDKVRQLVDTLG